MSGRRLCFSFILISAFLLVFPVLSIPEQGLFEFTLYTPESDARGYYNVTRSMFKDSYFIIKMSPFVSECHEMLISRGFEVVPACKAKETFSVQFDVFNINCANMAIELQLDDLSRNPEHSRDAVTSHRRKIFCNETGPIYLTCDDCRWLGNQTEGNKTKKSIPDNAAVVIPQDGIYVLVLSVTDANSDGPILAEATIEARSSYGYLSASDWPQLPFFRVMFVIYFFYMFFWLVLCCCHRADLLRIQYWVGGVVFIGLIEKAVFLGEYETLNKTGQSVDGAIIFGELVSSAKKMLSRMLVIIVSVGFGIVKPRLGTTLHKVLAVGLVYFIASSIEGCLRGVKERINQDRMMSIAELVLAVIDSCICWWIFSSLVQTMRTLRLRRNVVKLSLYRHFTNTLIFAVLASVGFMLWSTIEHKLAKCIQDWKELWVDEAFWHLLFAIVLLVIMILWRPSANNQRYAYSPLTDAADDEAEEPMINEAFDGIKMRNTKTSENNSNKADTQMEEDLKWIDDNIPTSVVDSALPSLLDSEEEVVATTYEMNKMQ